MFLYSLSHFIFDFLLSLSLSLSDTNSPFSVSFSSLYPSPPILITTKCIFGDEYFSCQKVLIFIAYDLWRRNFFFGNENCFIAYTMSPRVMATIKFIAKRSNKFLKKLLATEPFRGLIFSLLNTIVSSPKPFFNLFF